MVSFVGEIIIDAIIWIGGERLLRMLGLVDDETKYGEARFDSKTGKLLQDD